VQIPEMPDWKPPSCVGVEAKRIREQVGSEFEERLITRLLSDVRMKEVWRVLYQPHPSKNGQFKYSASAQSVVTKATQNAISLKQIQDHAVTLFFRSAYYYANNLDITSVLSNSQIQELEAPYAEAAHQLLELAKTLRGFGMRREEEELKKIAAKVKDAWPDDPYPDIWVTPKVRSRNGDSRHGEMGQLLNSQNLRRYVAQLANKSVKLFGKKLRGTVANVANVVFELEGRHEITGEQVRQILRSAPIPLSG
jgi:hypothetical protein